ncbi:MAG TPA: alpha-amylase family glycosyl hydrolase [Ktedonobacteraceae bacterium]|nr:alpha-amylase family glycosyl hydrolase [Ktedonobacteraceae bacterium]
MTQTHLWWQTGVIYQIYPRSFLDSNGDGVGDLPGITSKLDYLQWLGVDAIWLSPIFPSPMADFGYDISNYTDVHPLFGTLQDLDTLVQQAHQRGLKVILDYVPNHTSDEHPWFQESRSSRTNEKRDWYIWRDPAPGGGPPNNWASQFGGSAWHLDEQTGQYYLHLFDVKQVDLNWRNPRVRQAMDDVLRFWLERGIDGFRVDVLWLLLKDEQFRDNGINPNWKPGDDPGIYQDKRYVQDLPGIQDIVRDMRTLLDSYGERVFIGEIYLPIERLVKYYGEALDGAHMPFNFQFVTMPTWNARAIRQIVDAYETALPRGAWPNWVLGNHDKQRIATRVGRGQARLAQMLLLTLRGTPTCYYGDEIAMQNVRIPPEQLQDPKAKVSPEHSRDYGRTPMQWNASANAGFAAPHVKPWLPVAGDYEIFNVEAEQHDPRSMLMLVHALLERRRASPALTIGSYQTLDQENENCFVYLRQHNEQRFVVALNVSAQDQLVKLPGLGQGSIILSTEMDREGSLDLSEFHLRENEGCLIEMDE